MAENGNGFRKLSDALKKAAEEKGKALEKDAMPIITPPPAPEMDLSENIIKGGVDRRIITYYNPKDPISEQFRVLRAHIFSSEKSCNVKTIAVTSSSNGEGKTITAINLSVVMAQDLGKPVLLIDCSMRKPVIDSLLGLGSYKGLGDILSGGLQLKDALVKTDIPNLTVLPAGQMSVNPAELLSSEKIKALLAELKPQFEMIVLDMPAVIPYADPRILGCLVDGVVLVVRAGRTRREVVSRAEGMLKSVGANILGYLLTGVEYHIPDYIHRHL